MCSSDLNNPNPDSRPLGNQNDLKDDNLNFQSNFQPSFIQQNKVSANVRNLNRKMNYNLEDEQNMRLRSLNDLEMNPLYQDNYKLQNFEASNIEIANDNPYCEIFDKSIQKTYKSETLNQFVQNNELKDGMLYQGTLNKTNDYNLEMMKPENLSFKDQANKSIFKFQKVDPINHLE